MCGFAGVVRFDDQPADVERVREMAGRVSHRGPDDLGFWLSPDGRCALGFHRLAIIDPVGSAQPMVSDDGLVGLVFNGEIYNFRELRAELTEAGHCFDSSGDTEVLLRAYLEWGRDIFAKLDGMFAFALYDTRNCALLLARDRLGQKPLWLGEEGDHVCIASEAKAILGNHRYITNRQLLYYITCGYVPQAVEASEGVGMLPPATAVSIRSDGSQSRDTYWSPTPTPVPGSYGEAVEQVRIRMQAAVSRRLVADVPLGVLLSGGVDSSIVASLAAEVSDAPLLTFTAGFPDGRYDERETARATAAALGARHEELLLDQVDEDSFRKIVGHFDLPFGDSSAVPTWLICRAAKAHVTVALTGDGGDEAFGGYDRYRALMLADRARGWRYLGWRAAGGLAAFVAGHDERSKLRRLVRFTAALPYPFPVQYFIYRRLFGPRDLVRLLSDEFVEGLDVEEPAEWFCELFEAPDVQSEVQRAQLHDYATYLPDDLLIKADMCSMASGLELRSPFLDPSVVSFGLGLPEPWKIRHRVGKRILRDAFSDVLRPEVVRGRKRGFGIPLGDWLRGSLRNTMRTRLLDESFLKRGIFRIDAIHGLLNDHLGGRVDHAHRLWALMVLAEWLGGSST